MRVLAAEGVCPRREFARGGSLLGGDTRVDQRPTPKTMAPPHQSAKKATHIKEESEDTGWPPDEEDHVLHQETYSEDQETFGVTLPTWYPGSKEAGNSWKQTVGLEQQQNEKNDFSENETCGLNCTGSNDEFLTSVQSSKVQDGNHWAAHAFICWKCGYRTAERLAWTPDATYVCKSRPSYRVCEYTTGDGTQATERHLLLEHIMRTHTGEKPYVCGECGFRTAHRSNLSQHMKTHTDETAQSQPLSASLICEICGKSYKTKTQLARHHRWHEARIMCDRCQKAFHHAAGLKRHMELRWFGVYLLLMTLIPMNEAQLKLIVDDACLVRPKYGPPGHGKALRPPCVNYDVLLPEVTSLTEKLPESLAELGLSDVLKDLEELRSVVTLVTWHHSAATGADTVYQFKGPVGPIDSGGVRRRRRAATHWSRVGRVTNLVYKVAVAGGEQYFAFTSPHFDILLENDTLEEAEGDTGYLTRMTLLLLQSRVSDVTSQKLQ
ncbi:hypothetical protein Bbelb_039130 [Branchiostoma belcheri]|nr:hypothetical protein Bbelb_039130 [Branchiostoma belcheri]